MAHKELDKEDKLCNTCQHRGIKKMEKPDIVQTAQLLITVSYADQVQIEELCTNRGMSISDYFISLYHLDISDGFKMEPVDLSQEPQEEKKKAGRPKR